MQIKATFESMQWTLALLLAITLGVSVIVYVVLPVSGAKLGGGFFLALGAVNILFYRQTGREIFARAKSRRPFVVRFWERGGESGAQFLFLGIGVILAVAGCILLVAGVT